MLKKTALYDVHESLGARLVEFGGWEMPVQYSGIIDEHLAVRKSSGLFDISHMGEIFVSGSNALRFVNYALSNDAGTLAVGEGQYTIMCQHDGGVVDDLYVFRVDDDRFLLVVNASRIEAGFSWLESLRDGLDWGDFELSNQSDALSAVAVQGPRVIDFIATCIPGASVGGTTVDTVTQLEKNAIGQFSFGETTIWVSRTGYTGEDGFEVIAANDDIASVWRTLMAEGHQGCLQPIGLGARDTLRTEMGYPLYGHELSESISPLEAGLGFFVKLGKDDFVGHSALVKQKSEGLKRRSVAFKMTSKSPPPRPEYSVWMGEERVGETTSGSVSPSLKTGIGMALIDASKAKSGLEISIEIRGRRYSAIKVKKPIYLRD